MYGWVLMVILFCAVFCCLISHRSCIFYSLTYFNIQYNLMILLYSQIYFINKPNENHEVQLIFQMLFLYMYFIDSIVFCSLCYLHSLDYNYTILLCCSYFFKISNSSSYLFTLINYLSSNILCLIYHLSVVLSIVLIFLFTSFTFSYISFIILDTYSKQSICFVFCYDLVL